MSCFLIVCMLFTVPIPTFADATTVDATIASESCVPGTVQLPDTNVPCPLTNLKSFGGLSVGELKVLGEGKVKKGSTKLVVDSCSWYPNSSIEIGFYDSPSGIRYGVVYTGGSISNSSIRTINVPDGYYFWYVKNLGDYDITDGIIEFHLVGQVGQFSYRGTARKHAIIPSRCPYKTKKELILYEGSSY